MKWTSYVEILSLKKYYFCTMYYLIKNIFKLKKKIFVQYH